MKMFDVSVYHACVKDFEMFIPKNVKCLIPGEPMEGEARVIETPDSHVVLLGAWSSGGEYVASLVTTVLDSSGHGMLGRFL